MDLNHLFPLYITSNILQQLEFVSDILSLSPFFIPLHKGENKSSNEIHQFSDGSWNISLSSVLWSRKEQRYQQMVLGNLKQPPPQPKPFILQPCCVIFPALWLQEVANQIFYFNLVLKFTMIHVIWWVARILYFSYLFFCKSLSGSELRRD